MNKKPVIHIMTAKEKLEAGHDQTIDVLVRVSSPTNDAAAGRRPKLNLSLVLDRSGSMSGRKLDEAKDAANYCIDELLATDRISAVTFDDHVDVLIPSQPLETKERLKRAISSVQAGGSTALHEAWVRGGLEVSEHLEGGAIDRVLLITDGQANVGETSVERIVEQTAALAAKGVTTSTIGIGADFNEDLLMPMAEAGQGNAWHVQEPQDMVKIFATELNGLVNQIGHGVTMSIRPASGVTVSEVLNDFDTDADGRYKLPNLQAGSVMDIVVRLKVASRTAAVEPIAQFNIAYTSQESGFLASIDAELTLGFDTVEAVKDLPENMEVAKAVLLLMNARARREAMDHMDRGDYQASTGVLRAAAASSEMLFAMMPSPQMREEVDDLNEVTSGLFDRSKDAMSRKRILYRRDQIRKSK